MACGSPSSRLPRSRCGRWRARTPTRPGPSRVEVEPRLPHDPRLDGERRPAVGAHRCCSSNSREVGDDDVRAVLTQSVGAARRGHPDDVARSRPPSPDATPASASSKTTASCWLDAQVGRGGEERVGRGLAGQVALLRGDAVDPVVDQVGEPGDVEHLLGVGRGRHDGRGQPGVLHRVQVPHRAGVDLHPDGPDLLLHEVVLARRERVDRLRVRRRRRAPPAGSVMPRDRRKASVPARPGLAVDVGAVVGLHVERVERACRRARHAPAGSRRTSASTPRRARWPSRSARRRDRRGTHACRLGGRACAHGTES